MMGIGNGPVPLDLKNLQKVLDTLVLEDPDNRFSGNSGARFFDVPLLGVASGDDPLFAKLKDVASPAHLTPSEFFHKVRPDRFPDVLSVVSWVLPLSKEVRTANRLSTPYPAAEWMEAKVRGGVFQARLKEAALDFFHKQGVESVSTSDPKVFEFGYEEDPAFHVRTTWSERHVAYIAGLGTFGLCGGLISNKGKAIRLGSLICAAELPVTPRPYASHTEYCPAWETGQCRACMTRCPAGAISAQGKDSLLCKQRIDFVRPLMEQRYHLLENACGLCQVGVPCEARVPLLARHHSTSAVDQLT